MPRRLFALDQNFPQPIVKVLSEFQEEAELVPIGDIDERMQTLEDWEVLLALYHHERDWDGLITTDSSMLSLPRELTVLMQTHLTLVIAKESGHDPLKATGLLFAYLPGICSRTRLDESQLWTLRAAQPPELDPWDHLDRLAKRRGESAKALFEASKLTRAELKRDPLD
jgi:hypothetical protein